MKKSELLHPLTEEEASQIQGGRTDIFIRAGNKENSAQLTGSPLNGLIAGALGNLLGSPFRFTPPGSPVQVGLFFNNQR